MICLRGCFFLRRRVFFAYAPPIVSSFGHIAFVAPPAAKAYTPPFAEDDAND